MFTGLVEEIGRIARIERRGAGPAAGARLAIEMRAKPLVLGESISVDGVCLTVSRILGSGFEADASSETLARSTLGARGPGDAVHLERATLVGGRMGGHIVAGHVDGRGIVAALAAVGDARRLELRLERELAPFVAEKGSIALDGVSLTLNGVADGNDEVKAGVGAGVGVSLVLVPHTLGATKLGSLRPGDAVNVEVDVLARYVARQLALGALAGPGSRGRQTHGHGENGQPGAAERDESLLRKLRDGGYT